MAMDAPPKNDAASGSSSDEGVTPKKMDSRSQPEIIQHMDPECYEAAAEGRDIETFETAQLESILTPNKNTILHVHIMAFEKESKQLWKSAKLAEESRKQEKSTKFVGDILKKCPSLLEQQNAKGDTPLHVAAANGYSTLVEYLIKFAKESTEKDPERWSGVAKDLLTKKNKKGNSPLDEAALHCHGDVVDKLMEEDPSASFSTHDSGDTQSSMSTSAGESSVVQVNEKSATTESTYRRTALDVAVMNEDIEITRKIIEKHRHLMEVKDQNWWTPLHYAAYYGCSEVMITKLILECDSSAAYIGDKNRGMSPLHLASAQGHFEIMKIIMENCPDCYELVDKGGWNVLHYALLSLSSEELERLLGRKIIRSLLYEKNHQGYTPLQVLVTARPTASEYLLYHPHNFPLNYKKLNNHLRHFTRPVDLQKEIKDMSEDVSSGAGPYPKNVISIRGNMTEKESDNMDKLKESHSVVAALIATVTFAAAFTLPGGYKGEEGPDKGTAILSRNAAFIAFVITDTITMVLSMSAICIYFLMALNSYRKAVHLIGYATRFTLWSMVGMVLAFATGTYIVLTPSWLAVITCVFALCFFLMMSFIIYEGQRL